MEFSVHNSNAGNYPLNTETRSDQWRAAAVARETRGYTRATELGNSERVIEAYKVERVNHSKDVRELRPITYENSRLNKVRPFLIVSQNGRQPRFIDTYA